MLSLVVKLYIYWFICYIATILVYVKEVSAQKAQTKGEPRMNRHRRFPSTIELQRKISRSVDSSKPGGEMSCPSDAGVRGTSRLAAGARYRVETTLRLAAISRGERVAGYIFMSSFLTKSETNPLVLEFYRPQAENLQGK